MFDELNAIRFFIVYANRGRMEAGFNTVIIFKEAHVYLREMFAEKIDEG